MREVAEEASMIENLLTRFPALEGAAVSARRAPVRRRTADAGDCPRFDGAATGFDAR